MNVRAYGASRPYLPRRAPDLKSVVSRRKISPMSAPFTVARATRPVAFASSTATVNV